MGVVGDTLYGDRQRRKAKKEAESAAARQKELERGRAESEAISSADEAARRTSSRASNILARRPASAAEMLTKTLG